MTWKARTAPATRGVIDTNTDTDGYITITHGGPTAPATVHLTSRTPAWHPVLQGDPGATSFTVRCFRYADAATPTTPLAIAFDWTCDY